LKFHQVLNDHQGYKSKGQASMPMLEIKDLHTYYGNIHALKGISLTVEQGEIVSLIGGNGAGKTTTLRTICGLQKPRQGVVELEGEDLVAYKAHEIVNKGVAMVPEGRGIFARLSVLENLDMGAYTRNDKKKIEEDRERVFSIFPRLEERRKQIAGTLSGGEQQMLAIGRALMAHPRLLLLDEPSMGLAPILVEGIFETIKSINQEGTTVLLVEQNALMALSIANRGYVLQTGKIVLQDTAENLQQNETVQKAYLGVD
jgi:branched-chain amino acid transport system ATP-binding protein